MSRSFEMGYDKSGKKASPMRRRGKTFTKLIKEITLAARLGGGDPEGNARLRQAILAAKAENMPKDNIDRAIKKGAGELGGASAYEELTYEGYGPGGVAVLVDVMTDNKKRTVSEIRHIFSKYGGNLAENGAVAWLFEKKGSILVEKKGIDEDKLIEVALEAGAQDVREEENEYEIITEPASFDAVKKAVDTAGFKCIQAQISMIPRNTVKLNDDRAGQMLKLMEKLEDNDDVQDVYANFDIPDDVMERLS